MPRHHVLAVRCENDLLLHHIAPIGLAAALETALLVDLDSSSPAYPGRLTAADLISEGVRRSDLGPATRGVAVLGCGDVRLDQALELVDALAGGWPAVVIRAPDGLIPYPIVPVRPDFPAGWSDTEDACVRQPIWRMSSSARSGDMRLPTLRRGQVRAMLSGHVQPRWRWVKAWRPVWDTTWG